MRYLFVLLALLFTVPAHADAEYREGSDWIRVTALPCTDPAVLALLTAAGKDPAGWRAASAEVNGVPFAACWQPLWDRNLAVFQYADGDQGIIPFSSLKPVKSASSSECDACAALRPAALYLRATP
jgi:hypothetical protein